MLGQAAGLLHLHVQMSCEDKVDEPGWCWQGCAPGQGWLPCLRTSDPEGNALQLSIPHNLVVENPNYKFRFLLAGMIWKKSSDNKKMVIIMGIEKRHGPERALKWLVCLLPALRLWIWFPFRLVLVNAADMTLKCLCKCFENVSPEPADCLVFLLPVKLRAFTAA